MLRFDVDAPLMLLMPLSAGDAVYVSLLPHCRYFRARR